MATEKSIKAHQLKTAGWYWWRLSAQDEWRIDYFDPVKDKLSLKIAGGAYCGPVTPPPREMPLATLNRPPVVLY
jgi:hypothetical protein